MRIAIVEDDALQQSHLISIMTEYLKVRGIWDRELRGFSGSREFLRSFTPGAWDLVVLDIYIDQLSGIDLARKIRETDDSVSLVFCTTSNEFAAQSYEVNARYYLQKPVTPQTLDAMFRRIDLDRMPQRQSILLPDGCRVLVRQLIYTNYANHVVTFYIEGEEPRSVYMSQGEAEKLLQHSCFFPANKGNIINFSHVKRVTEGSFLLRSGEWIPISRRRYREAKDAFNRFHFQKLCGEAE